MPRERAASGSAATAADPSPPRQRHRSDSARDPSGELPPGGPLGGEPPVQPGAGGVPQGGSRFRSWCFTVNHYSASELASLRALVQTGAAVYCAFQPERGASGTPHLQGVAVFCNAKALGGAKRTPGLERAHLEPMRGSLQQARAYCCKEDSRDATAGFGFDEFGECPAGVGEGRGSRTDVAAAVELLRNGGTYRQVAEACPAIALRCPAGLLRIQSAFQRPRDFKTRVLWYWGPTGSGKTRAAYEEAGAEVYFKMSDNKWWDGYEGQENVIIDDYRRDFSTFASLLRLFDRYPLRIEAKGGSCQFVSKCIWVTSPKDPRATWDGRTEEELGQLLRRIDEVKHFPGEPEIPALFVNGFNPV